MKKRKSILSKKILAAALAVVFCMGSLSGCAEKDAVKLTGLRGSYRESDFVQEDVDSDTIQWICAAYAIYTEYNNKSLHVVGGLEEDDRNWYQESIQTALSQGWGIDGRRDVFRVVEKLVKKGHKEKFRKVIKEMEKKNLLELSEEEAMANLPDDEELPRYQTAYEAYQKYGEHGIDGWDYCRALQVLGDCYQAGYINLEECLDLSLPIAQKLQNTYNGWEGAAESYLYGYSFWKKEFPEDYDSKARWAVYEELKQMPAGPYRLAYDVKLENTWEGGAERKQAENLEDEKAGYVPVTCEESGAVKVRLPEEYVWDSEEESDTDVVFELVDEATSQKVTVTYKLTTADQAETEEAYALHSEEKAKERGAAGNLVETSGIQTKQVGDLEVTYLMIYEDDRKTEYQNLKYKAWAPVGGRYLLVCEVDEFERDEKGMKTGKDAAILDTLFRDIKW